MPGKGPDSRVRRSVAGVAFGRMVVRNGAAAEGRKSRLAVDGRTCMMTRSDMQGSIWWQNTFQEN